MRERLAEFDGQRITVTGIFERVGSTSNTYNCAPESNVIFKDIKDINGNFLADHIWMKQTLGFKSLGRLEKEDIIQVTGRCKKYGKNPRFNERGLREFTSYDYCLANPTKFKLVNR